MQQNNASHLSRRYTPPVGFRLEFATLGAWWRRRRTAKVLAGLSAEQIRDCGIESPELNVPTIEVPRGLMQKLMSMR
jgi:uncharacterized protein YjiS (DUF1127 family)